ncbi:MAG: ClpXP protease specificity-enhancing factor SspB [Acidobacteriota bacterium]
MTEQELDYQELVQEALRDVVRLVLERLRDHGLPEDHALYIAFQTTAPGVEVPPSLLRRHPEEMTIVLQHQYWDLAVDREAFAVTLAFDGSKQRVLVPFQAMTSFADPEGPFGLRFTSEVEEIEAGPEAVPEPAAEDDADESGEGEKVVSIDRFRSRKDT